MYSALEENLSLYKQWRHDIHSHPELAFNEQRTAKKVAGLLREIGCDEVHEGIANTGVVGILRNGDGPSIGLRADMDALPIQESSNHHYASTHPGVMHACGHDGHTVILLAAANHLAKTRQFKGTVVLIFQPAEEHIKGASRMLKEGLLERFPIDSIYTLHSWPGAPTTSLFAHRGAVMAAVNNFEIRIKTSGGHAAMPHLSPDPIVAGSAMIQALQTLASRHTDPQDAMVLSVTVFQSGNAYNIIPSEAILRGTVRHVSNELHLVLPEKMRDILEGTARAHNVSVELDYTPLCPATYNTDNEANLAQS